MRTKSFLETTLAEYALIAAPKNFDVSKLELDDIAEEAEETAEETTEDVE